MERKELNKSSIDKLALELAGVIDKEKGLQMAFIATIINLVWIYESRCEHDSKNWENYKNLIDTTVDIISCVGEAGEEWTLNALKRGVS